MAGKTGLGTTLTMGSVIANVTSINPTRSDTALQTTTLDDAGMGHHTFIPQKLINWSYDVEGNYDPATGNLPGVGADPVEAVLTVAPGGSGATTFTGQAFVVDLSQTVTTEGLMSFSATIQGTGLLTEGTAS